MLNCVVLKWSVQVGAGACFCVCVAFAKHCAPALGFQLTGKL